MGIAWRGYTCIGQSRRIVKITPKFGKVTFKGSLIPLTITNCGKKQLKFKVGGKPLWCKKFDPNKRKAFKRN